MLEGAEGISVLVCGSICVHNCVIYFYCELIVPLNGNAPRNHCIQQICHTWLPHYSHALRHAHGASSCPFDRHNLVYILYFFHDVYQDLCPYHTVCTQHHSPTHWTSPKMHCSLQQWKPDACDSSKNLYNPASWIMNLAKP